MDTAPNNIIAFRLPAQDQAAEKEKTLNAIKYQMAVSTFKRLLTSGEITPAEFERGRGFLARRFQREGV